MRIENYIFIALVYGLGVFLAWRGGYRNGETRGNIIATNILIKDIAKMSGKHPIEIAALITEFRKREYPKLFKSTGA